MMDKGFKTLQSLFARQARATVVRAGLVCVAAALSGCMSDRSEVQTAPQVGAAPAVTDTRSTLTKIISGGGAPHQVDPEAFAADLYCPSIRLHPNTHLIMKYKRGKEGDATALLYQATVEDWARDCSREGTDQTRVNVGVSGHITPGPAWPGGEVHLPVRVIFTLGVGKEPPISKVVDVPVTIGAGAPSESWTMVENSFVVQRNQEMQILVGFDEKASKRR